MESTFTPSLEPVDSAGLRLLTDTAAASVGINVVFTDRHGGVGEQPFDSLNLAMRVGDRADHVAENRTRVAAAAGFDARSLVLTRQVHGTELHEAGDRDSGVVGQADGLVARRPGPVLGLLSADCAAVVVAGDGVAVAHAGWRGLTAGIVERAVRAVQPVVAAWVGPAIRSCCYEVGRDVVDAFELRGLPVADRRHVDIADAARAALLAAGVPYVATTDACTSCTGDHFSRRRAPVTGRHAAFVWLTPVHEEHA
jgi:YfiH family protein